MKKLILSIGAILFSATASAIPLTSSVLAAPVDVINQSCEAQPDSELCKDEQKLFGPNSLWTNILNVFIFIIGAVAVIMIVIGGLRYTLSGGDQSAVTNAKNTILYSAIGLVVAVMASAFVNFVLSNI